MSPWRRQTRILLIANLSLSRRRTIRNLATRANGGGIDRFRSIGAPRLGDSRRAKGAGVRSACMRAAFRPFRFTASLSRQPALSRHQFRFASPPFEWRRRYRSE